MNLIKNSKITTEDVNLAATYFGPDVGTIKEKSHKKSLQLLSEV